MCIIKDLNEYFWRSGKIVLLKTKIIYWLSWMNSVFDYSLSGLLVLHKLKHFLSGKQDIPRKFFVSSGLIFSLGDTFFLND